MEDQTAHRSMSAGWQKGEKGRRPPGAVGGGWMEDGETEAGGLAHVAMGRPAEHPRPRLRRVFCHTQRERERATERQPPSNLMSNSFYNPSSVTPHRSMALDSQLWETSRPRTGGCTTTKQWYGPNPFME